MANAKKKIESNKLDEIQQNLKAQNTDQENKESKPSSNSNPIDEVRSIIMGKVIRDLNTLIDEQGKHLEEQNLMVKKSLGQMISKLETTSFNQFELIEHRIEEIQQLIINNEQKFKHTQKLLKDSALTYESQFKQQGQHFNAALEELKKDFHNRLVVLEQNTVNRFWLSEQFNNFSADLKKTK